MKGVNPLTADDLEDISSPVETLFLDSKMKNDFRSFPIKSDKIEMIIFCCLSEVILSIRIVLGFFPVVELE